MDNTKRDILEGLNPAQAAAVKCTEGPSLIVAGAGSGKTKVLTCRIAHLIDLGVKPSEILALTFTNKAAGEMKGRIAELVGENRAKWIWMGTFHSIFIRFLREYAERLGYPQQFTIYDQPDSRSAIKLCIKELNLDDKIYKPNVIQSRISFAKNSLRGPRGYRNDAEFMEEDRAARRPQTADIYDRYYAKCRQAGAMDFDDILLQMNILLRDVPEALQAISSRFKYILVDEYQDTNAAQYLIIRRLAAGHRNICVVGDDSQSIYGFRGARIENILRFRQDYPEAKEFRLEQNYRSTQNIVGAANSLIAHNANRLKKECFSTSGDGEKVQIIKGFTEQEEAYLTASSILERIHRDKAPYSSFAILYRTNAQSRAFEENLRRKNLPYKIYGGHSFFERAEVKDMLAWFRLVINNKDDEAFRRAVNNPPRGLGDTSMERLGALANAEVISLFEAVYSDQQKLLSTGLREATIKKFREFTDMIGRFSAEAATEEAFSLAAKIGDASGYVVACKLDKSPEGLARVENIEELFNSIREFSEEETEMLRTLAGNEDSADIPVVTISDYLEKVTLMSETEKDDMQDPDESNNRITLMTVHAAKGLEFPYVYVTGMEEGLFPSDSLNVSPGEIEEERRLFYVAITRAEKLVTISYAQNRMQWGKTETHPVSRFVKEIDRKYLEGNPFGEEDKISPWGIPSRTKPTWGSQERQPYRQGPAVRTAQPVRQTAPNPVARPSFSSPIRTPSADFKASAVSDLKVGQRVEHDRFGFGEITAFEDSGANMKAIVTFDEGGRKTLLLKFAKLRIVQ